MMKRLLYGLRMGNNNSYCLLLWIITGLLFVFALFVTIIRTPVFKKADSGTKELSNFQKELREFDAEMGFEWPVKEEKLQEQEQNQNWIPMLLFAAMVVVGIVFSRRKLGIGMILLLIGVLGLSITLLSFWRYGALSLWGAFVLAFLFSLIYTPFAFRDEVEELVQETREKIKTREQIEARINPDNPSSGGTDTTVSAQTQKGWLAKLLDGLKNSWIARIVSVDLTIEFLQTLVRRLFRSR